ncbi:MAG TPA: dihydrodipicolinate synthase family protein [Blastocatellia bacterium]|nr:dihydrodipicolinate synthase family protein [Blastocatellia bacterium]
MRYSPRRGLNVPIITVVDENGHVMAEDQRSVIRHLAQGGRGANVIFANGTTGEWNRLSNPQRQRLMEIAVDEVKNVNCRSTVGPEGPHVEVWLGVNGDTRTETLANLDAAIRLGADAAVIAPLAINDLDEADILRFFRRDMNDLFEAAPAPLPVFLYDNAEINAMGRHKPEAHIRTRLVKELSRLPWVCGLKVSASRRVLDNYTRAALHFKQAGEFGIYVGNANLIFDWFLPRRSWLPPHHLPIGVVSGPANVFPREWQKAWRVCWSGDEELMREYRRLAADFEKLTVFDQTGQPNQYTGKMIACLKAALEMESVIGSSLVAPGTPPLSEAERERFRRGYAELKDTIRQRTDPRWQTVSWPPKAGPPQMSPCALSFRQ